MTIQDKIAAWIHFTDSIGEGYGYFDNSMVDIEKWGTQDYIRWGRLKEVMANGYRIHPDYYEVAKRILEAIGN